VQLTEQHLGETITAPAVPHQVATTETRILDVRYISSTKDRGDGSRSAFAWIDGSWAAIFPEPVLRAWFNADARPDESPTLYAVLGVAASTAADELRSAYRRLARTWHPDVCREPDAKEQFQRIQRAYEVLRAPNTRARYDAGLALAASVASRAERVDYADTGFGYRAPLRCGLIMTEGHEVLGRFVVQQIIMWQDIVRGDGKVLVTSWPMGAEQPEEVYS
jgi:DnaJ-domain-containing protein 1